MAKPTLQDDPYSSGQLTWGSFWPWLKTKLNEILDWAESDAIEKANTAESNANSYTDTKVLRDYSDKSLDAENWIDIDMSNTDVGSFVIDEGVTEVILNCENVDKSLTKRVIIDNCKNSEDVSIEYSGAWNFTGSKPVLISASTFLILEVVNFNSILLAHTVETKGENLALYQSDIARHINKREGDVLIDSKAGLNAVFMGPVSYFNGTNGAVRYDVGESTVGYFGAVDISCKFKINSIGVNQSLFAYNFKNYRVFVNTLGRIYINGVNTDKLVDINTIYELTAKFDSSGNGTELIVDGVSVWTGSAAYENQADNNFRIGAGYWNGEQQYFDGLIWDFEMTGDTTLTIPLPHLKKGFDQNGDPVSLTVNNVTEDYTIGGSKWLIEKGAVLQRSSEKTTNGGFDTDSDWTKQTGWTISGGAAVGSNTSLLIFQASGIVADKAYYVEYEIKSITSGGVRARLNGSPNIDGTEFSQVGVYKEILYTVSGVNGNISLLGNNFSGEIEYISIREVTGTLPNKPDSTPISLGANDILIPPTNFLNTSPFMVDFGDDDSFFNKSNATIWKDAVRNDEWYDIDHNGRWHSSQLNLPYIEANLQTAYLNEFYPKIKNEVIQNLVVYTNPLTGTKLTNVQKWVQ